MGSIDKRLEALEQLIRPPEGPGDAHRRRLVRDFFIRALDALQDVKRSSRVAPEKWRYSVGKLRDESPATVAAYVCALRDQGHEDEALAREILEEKISEADDVEDMAALEQLMDAYAALASRARAELESRARVACNVHDGA
jgi:hypothetical protein